jgi:hypothetical protein
MFRDQLTGKPRVRGLYLWILLYGCAMVLCAIYFTRSQENASTQMEAVMFVSQRVQEHVAQHRAWPTSWNDLAGVEQINRKIMVPRDTQWLAARVQIDFHAQLPLIAMQTPATFTGFRPVGRPAHDYSNWYRLVINSATRAAATTTTSAP